MGLDMYLDGDKYLALDFNNPENALTEDGYRLTNKMLRLGYWRKHPNLHGYIVNSFGDGVDQCQRIDLNGDDIEKIIDAVARDDLPHTEGFFFGVSDSSERDETLRIFRDALQWLRTAEPNVFRSVSYQASW